MQPPCYKCPDRHIKCHAECEKYKEYTKHQQEIKDNEFKNKLYYRYLKDRKDKTIKYNRVHGKK